MQRQIAITVPMLKQLLLGGGILTAATVGYGVLIEAKRPIIERITIPIDNLPPQLDGMTIVQLSDFHPAGSHRSTLLKAIEITRQLAPDLIVLTGDYVDRNAAEALRLIVPFSTLSAPQGVYACLGNRDIWEAVPRREQIVTYSLAYAGIPLLKNAHVRLPNGLVLAGIRCTPLEAADLPRALDGVTAADTVIALVHRPDFADAFAQDGRIALQLSGHTHGGQIVVPGMRPPHLPHYGKKYVAGKYRIGRMWLYVNRGIGTGSYPIRLNCPPEVTHLTLIAARS